MLNPRTAEEVPTDAVQPPAEALEHYHLGRELYQAGRYREAVVELERASSLDPGSANLVYNLARVYELLGEIDLAIHHYVRFRDMLPESETEERARVEGTLQRLAGARDQVSQPVNPPPAQVIVRGPEPTRRGVADAAFWTFASGSVATLAGGGVLGVMALQEERSTRRFTLGEDGDGSEREEHATRADRLALSSDLAMLAGATFGITAILLYALRERPTGAGPQTRVDLGAFPGGGLLMVGGRL